MINDSDKLANLILYVKNDRRVCPMPDHWKTLWEMLPARERIGNSWKPSLPLILAAWWNTSAIDKQLRLQEHIEYANRHGVLDKVDTFLRALSPSGWFKLEDE